jgi:hypothetical protein
VCVCVSDFLNPDDTDRFDEQVLQLIGKSFAQRSHSGWPTLRRSLSLPFLGAVPADELSTEDRAELDDDEAEALLDGLLGSAGPPQP